MDEILNTANELGLLIKETEIYSTFQGLFSQLESDPASQKLLQEYLQVKENLHQQELTGNASEIHEIDKLKRLYDLVSANRVILDFLDARDSYINLLSEIQNSII